MRIEARLKSLEKEMALVREFIHGQREANHSAELVVLDGSFPGIKFTFPDNRAPGTGDTVAIFERGMQRRHGAAYDFTGADGSYKFTYTAQLAPVMALWLHYTPERVRYTPKGRPYSRRRDTRREQPTEVRRRR